LWKIKVQMTHVDALMWELKEIKKNIVSDG
jgi:hypothetical protein